MASRRKTSTKPAAHVDVRSRQEKRAALRGYTGRTTYSSASLRAHFDTSKYMPHQGANVRYTTIIGRDGKRQGIARHRVA